jgi:putative FmdB family regulatory protein
MPFYEYQCTNCEHYLEALQKISDAPLKKCPSCGRSTLKKLISAPIFRLKGGGWYETDFKSDKENKRNLAGESEPAASETKVESKTEAKTETKTESKSGARADAKPDSKPAVKAETKPVAKKTPAAKAASRSKRRAAR